VEAIDITEAEILEALRASLGKEDLGPKDAFTRGEIAAAMGWGLTKTSHRLVALKAKGQLEVVRVKRQGLDDRPASVAAYRFIRPKKRRD
jgi:hypothetical protein